MGVVGSSPRPRWVVISWEISSDSLFTVFEFHSFWVISVYSFKWPFISLCLRGVLFALLCSLSPKPPGRFKSGCIASERFRLHLLQEQRLFQTPCMFLRWKWISHMKFLSGSMSQSEIVKHSKNLSVSSFLFQARVHTHTPLPAHTQCRYQLSKF